MQQAEGGFFLSLNGTELIPPPGAPLPLPPHSPASSLSPALVRMPPPSAFSPSPSPSPASADSSPGAALMSETCHPMIASFSSTKIRHPGLIIGRSPISCCFILMFANFTFLLVLSWIYGNVCTILTTSHGIFESLHTTLHMMSTLIYCPNKVSQV